jgi:AraC family transcriptional regulator of adaptative response / DNA-3-methyladenine glycosylase II
MPAARQASVKALAEAALADPNLFRASRTIENAIARFRLIRGVGEWTAQYIALCALREMDAFPASDAALLRAARMIGGLGSGPRGLLHRADAWRPWRAYGAQHLWAAQAAASFAGDRA